MIYRQVLFKDWSDKMKHKLEYTIASVLAVSSLGLQTLPLYAQEMNIVEQDPVEIKTAKDFKEQFLCLKKIEIKDGKEEISYQLIETIDDTNYEQILAGKLFYEQLSLDVSIETKDQSKALKEEIDALFKNEEEPIDFDHPLEFGYSNHEENVLLLKDYLKDIVPNETKLCQISPVVGAHVGPGASAFFYISKNEVKKEKESILAKIKRKINS